MEVKIQIQKKHLYIISILLLIFFGILVSGAIDKTKGWLPIDRIARDSTGAMSLDENSDGKIDVSAIEFDPASLSIELYDCSFDASVGLGTYGACPTNKVLIGGYGCGGRYCGGLSSFQCCKMRLATTG